MGIGHDSGSAAASALRISLMLMLGLVLLARGLEYMNDGISQASRSPRRALADARAAAAEAEAMAAEGTAPSSPVLPSPAAEPARVPAFEAIAPQTPTVPDLPPAPDRLIRALESDDAEARGSTLRQLRSFGTTPELQAALTAAAAQATMPWERASITCLRVRDRGIPIDRLFEVLPTDPPQAAAWRQEPATCVIDAIAARADESPARVAPVLAEAALSANRPALTDALMRLEPQPLPPAVLVALGRGNASNRRKAAIRTAVAVGAARTAPAAVAEWLDDPDREVRLVAIRALLERIDEASQATAARAVSANPGDAELQRLAMARLGTDGAFERHLAALGEDVSAPNFVRAQAAYLVSRRASR